MTIHWLDPDALDDEEGTSGGVLLEQPDWPADDFVRVPKVIFRQLMPGRTGAEFKVLCFLVERICSYNKHASTHSDLISYGQMQHGVKGRDGRMITLGTGLSRGSIVAALRGLEADGLIRRTQRLRDSGGRGISRIKLIFGLSADSARVASGEGR